MTDANSRTLNFLSLTRLKAACGSDSVSATSQMANTVRATLVPDVLPTEERRWRTVHRRCSAISVMVKVDT